FWISGQADRALEALGRSVDIAEELGDAGLRILANVYLSMCHGTRGDYLEAVAGLTAVMKTLKSGDSGGEASDPFRGVANVWLEWAHAERGAFQAAIAEADEALRLAKVMAQPFYLVHANVAVGFAHVHRGDVDAVIPMLEDGIGLCEAAEIPLL